MEHFTVSTGCIHYKLTTKSHSSLVKHGMLLFISKSEICIWEWLGLQISTEHTACGAWFAQPCTNPCLKSIKQPRSQYIKWQRNEPINVNKSNSNDVTNTAALAEAASMAVKIQDQYFGTSKQQSKIQAKATRESPFIENVYWERTNRDDSLSQPSSVWTQIRDKTVAKISAILQRINDNRTWDSATCYTLHYMNCSTSLSLRYKMPTWRLVMATSTVSMTTPTCTLCVYFRPAETITVSAQTDHGTVT